MGVPHKAIVDESEKRLTKEDLNPHSVYKICTILVKSAKYDFYRTYYTYRSLLEERRSGVVYNHQLAQARDAFYGSLAFFRSDLFDAMLMLKGNMTCEEYIKSLINEAKKMYESDPNQYVIAMNKYREEYC